MFAKNKKKELVLEHDAVMGDLTQVHEHLVLVAAENVKKLTEALLLKAEIMKDCDEQIAHLEHEKEKIDRSMKFFSAFEASR